MVHGPAWVANTAVDAERGGYIEVQSSTIPLKHENTYCCVSLSSLVLPLGKFPAHQLRIASWVYAPQLAPTQQTNTISVPGLT